MNNIPPDFQKLLESIKGIIFDFDGTIFDNKKIAYHLISQNPFAISRIWNERLIRSRYAGIDFSEPENYFNAFFKDLGKACHLSPEQIRIWYFEHYMPGMVRVLKKHYKPRDRMQELLNYIDTSKCLFKVAVYSDYPFVKERMQALKLYIPQNIRLYGPESFGAQKPSAKPFLQIARDLNLAPEEILMVGDREDTDGLGAASAGMYFYHLKTGHSKFGFLDPSRVKKQRKLQENVPSAYAGTWNELMKMLQVK